MNYLVTLAKNLYKKVYNILRPLVDQVSAGAFQFKVMGALMDLIKINYHLLVIFISAANKL